MPLPDAGAFPDAGALAAGAPPGGPPAPPGPGAAGAGFTGWFGRTRCTPSDTTVSPSCNPADTVAIVPIGWPSVTRRCNALLSAPTTQT